VAALLRRLEVNESRLRAAEKLCLHCAGSGVDSHACHRAFHCQNYFLKIDASDGVERIRGTTQGLQLG